jgi:hypothetical protein
MAKFKKLSEDKDFLATVEDIVKGYSEQISEFIQLHRDDILADSAMNAHKLPPPDPENIDLTSNLSPLGRKIVRGIIAMMRVTMFTWTDHTVLKATPQYVQTLGTIIMHKPHTLEILGTEAGWDMYSAIGRILNSQRTESASWSSWMDIIEKPTVNAPMDIQLALEGIPGESSGNANARSMKVSDIRQRNTRSIQKMLDGIFTPQLGAMEHSAKDSRKTLSSPDVYLAAQNLVKVSADTIK